MTEATAAPVATPSAPAATPAVADPVAALEQYRGANQAALFDTAHKDHHTALAAYRALADKAFPNSEAKPADAAPDAMTAAMAGAMGDVPADPSGYQFDYPHGTQMTPEFEKFDSGVRGLMLEMKLPAHLGRFAWSRANEITKNGPVNDKAMNAMGDAAEATLRQQWGSEYDARLAAARSVIDGLPAEKATAVRQLLYITGLSNDVRFITQLALLAQGRHST